MPRPDLGSAESFPAYDQPFIPAPEDSLFSGTLESPSSPVQPEKQPRVKALRSKGSEPAKELITEPDSAEHADIKENQRDSIATHLIKIAERCELWCNQDQQACVTWELDGHFQNAFVESTAFSDYLSAVYFVMTGQGVNETAMKTALCTIRAKAIHAGIHFTSGLRLAGHGGKIYLDLGNETWDVIEITEQGWSVMKAASPVRFLRRRGLRPLPMPNQTGGIGNLWNYLNVANENRVLIAGFILQCFNPWCGYFGLNLHGGAGTAKTTATQFVRNLIDPNQATTASFPKDARELFISASAQRVLAYDNVSHLTGDESDWLCRMSTGDAYRSRTLYTNFDETILIARNPWIINGIPNVVARGDLLERGISVELLPIPKEHRITDSSLRTNFETDLPCILGGFLRAVVDCLRNYELVSNAYQGKLPRMAEASAWITAGESAIGFREGEFLTQHEVMSGKSCHESIDGDLVATELVRLVEEEGGLDLLIGELRTKLVEALDWKEGRSRGHPLASPKSFGAYLTRLAPTLMSAHGISIKKDPIRKKRGWRVEIKIDPS